MIITRPLQKYDAKQSWHAISAKTAERMLATSVEGLEADDVAARRAQFGANELPQPPRKTPLEVYLSQFKSAFIYLLLAAAVVSLILGDAGDALFIFVVLQINAVIGTFQEWRAQENAAKLETVVQAVCMVRRDGAWQSLDSSQLVPGDIVRVVAGMNVPAAVRLVSSQSLEVDESLLTGESMPVIKDAALTLDEVAPLAERGNMLHAGTSVLRGEGVGIVCAIGLATEVGQVALALSTAGDVAPPLIRRMREFTRTVAVVMLAVIVLIALVEISRGASPEAIFLMAVALAVAAVPEGLPVALTVALSIGVTRMARRNVVVRKLAAVEGLGSCTLIAADKTGTLTRNELSVQLVHLPERGDVAFADMPMFGASPEMDALLVTTSLCNDAQLRAKPDGEVEVIGDTVDGALLQMARRLDLDEIRLARDNERLGSIPYDCANAFAASFHQSPGGSMAYVKGATEVVLPMCALADGEDSRIMADMQRLAGDGYRVLAVAQGLARSRDHEALQNMTFLGLVALMDPLRESAKDAVNRCRNAGVEVRMITGDHPLTALAIGKQLGIATGEADILTGTNITALESDHAALDAAVARAHLFARISPTQKLVIVQSMQRGGHVVAVTGDGVNDAPALAVADIGAAMGKSGTDIARSAADLILTDDKLGSLADGIGEGRVAYDNIRKVIYFLISTGAAEIVLFVLSIAAGLPLPLSPVQLLWLNLVTSGIQDVTLAFEKGEPDTLLRKPRPKTEGIFNRRMIEQLAISGGIVGFGGFIFFQASLSAGLSAFEASNMLLLMLVLFENAHVFNCRSERRSAFLVPLSNNRWLIFAVFLAQGLHIAAMHIPVLGGVLDVAPVSFNTWVIAAIPALLIIAVMEGYKYMTRHRIEHATNQRR